MVQLVPLLIPFTFQSRESWLYSLQQPAPLDHGEKSGLEILLPSLDIPKLDQYELETFINLPVTFLSQSGTALQTKPVQGVSSSVSQALNGMRRDHAEASGVFYEPKTPKLKLEMEQFGDLSVFCQPTKAGFFQSAVDELNTPVFEKALFDYDRPPHNSGLLDVLTSTEDLFNYKIKSEISCIDNVNIEDNLIKGENLVFKESESKDIATIVPIDATMPLDNYIVITSPDMPSSSNVFTSSSSGFEGTCHNINKVTPLYMEDDEYLPTVNNCSDIFFSRDGSSVDVTTTDTQAQISNSSQQYVIIQTAPFETPENSIASSDYSDKSSPPLTLKIGKFTGVGDTIDTPEVIDTIDAIENEKGFNIINFITNEDIQVQTPIQSTVDLTAVASNIISHPVQAIKHSRLKAAPKRRRKEEDDDEDYVPPVPVKKRFTKVESKQPVYESDSDDSDDSGEVKPPKQSRRGRPPRRNYSVTSEDCPGTKYREMRDKNNEASRKSRLKRKLKEVAVEGEADHLEERNIKLKAQVQELERTVNNFKSNLMQLLLKK